MIRFRAIDVETTGMPPDAALVEIGWHDILVHPSGSRMFPESQSIYINPGIPIPAEARAIHHISDEDVANGWDERDAVNRALSGADVFVAHNAEFEKHFLRTSSDWICTWKLALALWPDLPAHSNQFLRYHLDLQISPAKAMPPHRAGPDAYVTANIFAQMLDHLPVNRMIEISAKPALLPKITFGQYRGKTYKEVSEFDTGYLQWIIRQGGQSGFDENVVYTASEWLRRRNS